MNAEEPTSPNSDPLIVTIDGPAGSGKSTLARQLAARLGLDFLDTGAMYRGVAAKAIERGIDIPREPYYVVELARNCPLRFDWATDPPRLYARDADVTDRLRDRDVTDAVSDVASIGAVRQVLVEEQRCIGEEHPRLVTEGRDQGSIVFPGADVKFYLDASPAVRAQRRADQLREMGKPVHLDAIRKNIIERDRKDSTRPDGPLICPDNAIKIDTSEMTLAEVLDLLEQNVRVKVGLRVGG
ncbi:MAG: (d)CMP kinase [Planctomycetota bacterium]